MDLNHWFISLACLLQKTYKNHEDNFSHYPLVYIICAVLAHRLGHAIPASPDMVDPVAIQNNWVHSRIGFQTNQCCTPFPFPAGQGYLRD